MMLLEAPALGAVGIAGDIPENTSILPPGYPTFAAVQRAGHRCSDPRQRPSTLYPLRRARRSSSRAGSG